jgi:hypothetical protein
MTALPRQVPALVRRLSTPHDGEIIATVHALRRVLEGVGLDLHAVADRLERGQPLSAKPRKATSPRTDYAALFRALAAAAHHPSLSPWERSFARSMLEQPPRPLTPKQRSIVDRIISKAGVGDAA